MNSPSNIWLRRLSKLTVFSTLFLIFAGALVKSHEVGLSVPDWPTTYGKQMFAFPLSDMVGGIFYEHGHRMIATIVGLFTMIQAIWLGFSNYPYWLKKLGYGALAMVIIQGLFGGITVLFFLPPTVSIIHGILAQTFFILTIIIAYSLSKERQIRIKNGMVLPIRKGAMLMGLAVYIQLILGALMRHTASGLAIPDFPTMGGLWIPTFTSGMVENINSILFDLDLDPVSKGQIIIHFLHRFGAVVVTGIIGYFYVKFGSEIKENQLGQFTLISIMTILVIQFSLGALTVLSIRAPYIASFHVVTGAALLGLCTLFLLKVNSLKLNEWKLK